MATYPEHEKLKAVHPQGQAIGEFLEWLTERGIQLAHWQRFEGAREDRLTVYSGGIQRLLAEYFKIDQRKLDTEKASMLVELRKGAPEI